MNETHNTGADSPELAAAREIHPEYSVEWWETVAFKSLQYQNIFCQACTERERKAAIIARHFAPLREELARVNKTLEAYRVRARKIYTPEVAASKIAEREEQMRDVDSRLETALAVLRYFGLEVVSEIAEGVLMLMTEADKHGINSCAYVRPIPGGSYSADQSELKLLREEFDQAQKLRTENAALREEVEGLKAEAQLFFDAERSQQQKTAEANTRAEQWWSIITKTAGALGILDENEFFKIAEKAATIRTQFTAAEARCTALEADKERLDWLIAYINRKGAKGIEVMDWTINNLDNPMEEAELCFDRAAIDAARQRKD